MSETEKQLPILLFFICPKARNPVTHKVARTTRTKKMADV